MQIRKPTYGTKTALYSCSRHITQRSGIGLSFLLLSDPFSAFPFDPEATAAFIPQLDKKHFHEKTNASTVTLPSTSCPDLLAAAARTLHREGYY